MIKKLLSAILIFSFPIASFAADDVGEATSTAESKPTQEAKKKSVGTAILLGLDPIPGDALLYAGKRRQAVGNIALGAAGAVIAILAFSALPIKREKTTQEQIDELNGTNSCHSSNSSPVPCYNFDGFGSNLGANLGVLFLGFLGSAMYVGSLVWDGVGGITSVKRHNKRIAGPIKKSEFSLMPHAQLALLQNGANFGMQWKF